MAARGISSLFKELTKIRNPNSKVHLNFFRFTSSAHYCTTPQVTAPNIYFRIAQVSSPNTKLEPVLEQWIRNGNIIDTAELRTVIHTLRNRKRFQQALEVTEWMWKKRVHGLYSADRAIRLDLIGRVHGIKAAEYFFTSSIHKPHKLHGALLNCYIREGLVDEALCFFQKMKEKRIAKTLSYNNIMNMYSNMKQHEKIPDLFSDMKANGIVPDSVTYGICLKSYALRSDFESIEKLIHEVESQNEVPIHWSIYLTAGKYYLGAGFQEKAIHYMKKAEEKVEKDPIGYNNLIYVYTSLGNKSEVMRLWDMKKITSRRQNNTDYASMMSCLTTLDEVEEVENLFEKWRKAGNLYDFRIPNILLTGYVKRGLVEKAEKFLEEVINEAGRCGRSPIPNTWSIMALGYVDKGDMEKALEYMEKAFALQDDSDKWSPIPVVVSSILNWLSEEGDVERVKKFVDSLRKVVPVSREMYHALLKVSIKRGDEVDGILQDMKADNIEEDEETKMIITSSSAD